MKQVLADERLDPTRIRVEIDGETVAQGSVSQFDVMSRALRNKKSILYMHPDLLASYERHMLPVVVAVATKPDGSQVRCFSNGMWEAVV